MSRNAPGLILLGCHERLGELELVPGLVEARLEAGERAGLSFKAGPGLRLIRRPDSRGSSLRQGEGRTSVKRRAEGFGGVRWG